MPTQAQLVRQKIETCTRLQSWQVVTNLLKTTIGSIAYLRLLFPEDHFVDSQVNGLKLKSVDKTKSPEAAALVDWLEIGCFEALEKKYLRSLVFGIYRDATDPDSLIESYKFDFSYPADGLTHLSVSSDTFDADTGKQVSNELVSKKEIMRATMEMLRRLLVTTQTLKRLPDKTFISMKLFYYDEITPVEYEPPCFEAADATQSQDSEKEDLQQLRIGDVQTGYHGVGLLVQTALSDLEQVCDETLDEDTLVHPEQADNETLPEVVEQEIMCDSIHSSPPPTVLVPETQQGSPSLSQQDPIVEDDVAADSDVTMEENTQHIIQQLQGGPSETPHEQSSHSPLSAASSSESYDFAAGDPMATQPCPSSLTLPDAIMDLPEPSLSAPVKVEAAQGTDDTLVEEETPATVLPVTCPCDINKADGDMIQCTACLTYGHAACFGYRSLPSSANPHVCYTCINIKAQSSAVLPRYNLNMASQVAMYRRILSVVWKEGLPSVSWLAERLGISMGLAQQQVRQLQKDKIIQKQTFKRRRSNKKQQAEELNNRHQYKVLQNSQEAQLYYDYWFSSDALPVVKHEPVKDETPLVSISSPANTRKRSSDKEFARGPCESVGKRHKVSVASMPLRHR